MSEVYFPDLKEVKNSLSKLILKYQIKTTFNALLNSENNILLQIKQYLVKKDIIFFELGTYQKLKIRYMNCVTSLASMEKVDVLLLMMALKILSSWPCFKSRHMLDIDNTENIAELNIKFLDIV